MRTDKKTSSRGLPDGVRKALQPIVTALYWIGFVVVWPFRSAWHTPYMQRNKQLLIPLTFMAILLLINVIRSAVDGANFFSIRIVENNYGTTLQGYPIMILNGAVPLVIISLGMTLVTAACGGQDISVGALSTIAAATFYRVIATGGLENPGAILWGIVICCAVTMVFGAFNGALVSIFRIQPMIATLILFSCGRKIANWIAHVNDATFDSVLVKRLGFNLPDTPVPTPLLICLAVGLVFFLLIRCTNLGLYAQSVGINQSAARLNGINPTLIKLLTFVILGACCSMAGFVKTSIIGKVGYETFLPEIEMDAILAVAIGGNSLGGGKFSLAGSVLGAYTLQTLSTTLDRFYIDSTDIKAYKAIVIILLIVIASEPVKKLLVKLSAAIQARRNKPPEIPDSPDWLFKEGVQ